MQAVIMCRVLDARMQQCTADNTGLQAPVDVEPRLGQAACDTAQSVLSPRTARCQPCPLLTLRPGRRFLDAELQQRAVEYLGLEARPEVAKQNVVPMPPWEKRRSLLLRRMAAKEVSVLLCVASPVPCLACAMWQLSGRPAPALGEAALPPPAQHGRQGGMVSASAAPLHDPALMAVVSEGIHTSGPREHWQGAVKNSQSTL